MYTQNDIEKAYLYKTKNYTHYTSFSFQFHLELNHEFIIQFSRSEERRVGKEGRSRWGPDHWKKTDRWWGEE